MSTMRRSCLKKSAIALGAAVAMGAIVAAVNPAAAGHTRSDIHSKRDDRPYVVVLLMLVIASLLLYAIFDIPSASAQSACGDRTDILEELATFYSERPKAMGLSADGKVIEVLNSSTGSWSILVNYPNGTTCLVATGENWERLPVVATGPSA